MTQLPAKYGTLATEGAPRMLVNALALLGTLELKGPGNNPVIVKWADEAGAAIDSAYADWAADWYNSDSVAWCGLFMAVVAVRSGRPPAAKYLSALAWAEWGLPVPHGGAMLGDVLVFKRAGGGHVSLYVGEDETHFHMLGGNQSDAVNIMRKAKSDLYAVRRPAYKNTPSNVRKIYYSSSDSIVSVNEA